MKTSVSYTIAEIFSNFLFSRFLEASDTFDVPRLRDSVTVDDTKFLIKSLILSQVSLLMEFQSDLSIMPTHSFIRKYSKFLPLTDETSFEVHSKP